MSSNNFLEGYQIIANNIDHPQNDNPIIVLDPEGNQIEIVEFLDIIKNGVLSIFDNASMQKKMVGGLIVNFFIKQIDLTKKIADQNGSFNEYNLVEIENLIKELKSIKSDLEKIDNFSKSNNLSIEETELLIEQMNQQIEQDEDDYTMGLK